MAVGAPALLVAAFAGVGLAQADGAWAWLVFLVYSPFYLLGHAFSAEAHSWPDSAQDAAVFAAQFLYFLLIVAGVRYLGRRRRRARA
jgi:hypothetical protein